MVLFTLPVAILGYLATRYSDLSGFIIWPVATIIVLAFGLSFFNVDKTLLGVSVRNNGSAGRAWTIFFMAVLAEVIYTSCYLTDILFEWVSAQKLTF